MKIKLIKVGTSRYLIVPSHFIKVFNLDLNNYDIKVKDNGNKIIYEKIVEDEIVEEVKDENEGN